MIRVYYLFGTLVAALFISALSFFYIRSSVQHGFPFSYAISDNNGVSGVVNINFNLWSFAFDVLFWWLLFSILLIIVKNYVFESE